jgi:hypothetical protein
MAQIEYNDLNKFYVSIGVTLLAITFALPWLYIKEPFDLLIKTDDLHNYTTYAQKILLQRQRIAGLLSIIVPIASAITFTVGLVVTYRGIKGWRRIQYLIDEREKLTNEIQVLTQERERLTNKKLTIEITTLSKEEKIEKVEKEVEQFQIQAVKSPEALNDNILELFKQKYLLHERRFQDLVENRIGAEYKVYNDAKIETTEFDLVLSSMRLDFVFDIKYSEGRIEQKFLNKYLENLNGRLIFYKENIKVRTRGRLIVLLTEEAIRQKGPKNTDLDYQIVPFIDYKNQTLRGTDISISYFEVKKLDSYSKDEIVEKLKL